VIKIIVPGRPVAAVRMTQRGKYVSKQAGRYLAYKNHVAWIAKAAKQKHNLRCIDGPVEVIAVAYLYGKREPDADNLAKSFLDSMNGIIWQDDRQVRRLTVEKVVVENEADERAEIEIRAI
jgi:crossover junction endodeoxyribonuclease RusA